MLAFTLLMLFCWSAPTLLAGNAWHPVSSLLENLEYERGLFWPVSLLATAKILSMLVQYVL